MNVNNVPIERAKGYKYLGVYLSSSGSSAEVKEDLYKRGLKSLFRFKYIIITFIANKTLAGKAIQYNITKHIYMNNIKKCHTFIVKVIH